MKSAITLFLCVLSLSISDSLAKDHSSVAPESPEQILEQLVSAYSNNDLAALEHIYADDYQSYPQSDNPSVVVSRDQELKSAASIFESNEVESMTMSYAKEFHVAQGDTPDVWILEDVAVTSSIEFPKNSNKSAITVTEHGIRITVREVRQPNLRYEIVKWESTR